MFPANNSKRCYTNQNQNCKLCRKVYEPFSTYYDALVSKTAPSTRLARNLETVHIDVPSWVSDVNACHAMIWLCPIDLGRVERISVGIVVASADVLVGMSIDRS